MILALAYSPDGKSLATAGEDRTIQLRDVAAKATLRTLPGHADVVDGAGVRPRRQDPGLGRLRQARRLWDVARAAADGAHGAQELGPRRGVFARRQDAGVGRLRQAGQALGHETEGGRQPRGHGASVRSVAIRPTARRWPRAAATDGEALGRCRRARSGPRCGGTRERPRVALFARRALVASAAEDDTIKLWDAARPEERATLAGHADIVAGLAFAPSGDAGLGGLGQDGPALGRRRGDRADHLRGHSEAVAALAFAPDGPQLATGGHDMQVKLWEANPSGPARLVFKRTRDTPVRGLRPDGRRSPRGARRGGPALGCRDRQGEGCSAGSEVIPLRRVLARRQAAGRGEQRPGGARRSGTSRTGPSWPGSTRGADRRGRSSSRPTARRWPPRTATDRSSSGTPRLDPARCFPASPRRSGAWRFRPTADTRVDDRRRGARCDHALGGRHRERAPPLDKPPPLWEIAYAPTAGPSPCRATPRK